MLRLYDYVASANCFKVRLLLAQLGREYERVPVDIFDGDTLTDEFAALNPFRSTPVLQLEDGRTLIESNAILWYLASGTPFLPDDAFGQAEVARWLLYEQTDVMPGVGGLRFRLVTGRLEPGSVPRWRAASSGSRLLRRSTSTCGRRRSWPPAATRSPTSPSTRTRTSPGTWTSTRARTRRSTTGSVASPRSLASSPISSRTRRTPPCSPASPRTASFARSSSTRRSRSSCATTSPSGRRRT